MHFKGQRRSQLADAGQTILGNIDADRRYRAFESVLEQCLTKPPSSKSVAAVAADFYIRSRELFEVTRDKIDAASSEKIAALFWETRQLISQWAELVENPQEVTYIAFYIRSIDERVRDLTQAS